MLERNWNKDEIVDSRYRLKELIGEGGMGQVWRAEHLELRADIALKLMTRGFAGTKDKVTTKLLREARAAAALRSPHVVQILDYGVHEDSVPYIAMELLEGEALCDRLERIGGPLPLDKSLSILKQIGKALSKAHSQGLVHRDLKPENIFLVSDDDDDEEELVKVLDFGIAKLNTRLSEGITRATRVGALLGTPNYMSPEQAEADEAIDHRTDIWALALIAFELFTGKIAFDKAGLGELIVSICAGPIPIPSDSYPSVPAAFDAWFLSVCQRDPELRPQSAKELVRSLQEALGGASVGDVLTSGVLLQRSESASAGLRSPPLPYDVYELSGIAKDGSSPPASGSRPSVPDAAELDAYADIMDEEVELDNAFLESVRPPPPPPRRASAASHTAIARAEDPPEEEVIATADVATAAPPKRTPTRPKVASAVRPAGAFGGMMRLGMIKKPKKDVG